MLVVPPVSVFESRLLRTSIPVANALTMVTAEVRIEVFAVPNNAPERFTEL